MERCVGHTKNPMTLISKPILIAIDNSIIGKVAKDFFSKNVSKRIRANQFIESLVAKGYVPIFCYHHILEYNTA